MSCCGGKREAMAQRRTRFVAQTSIPDAPSRPRISVLFTGTGAFLVAGPYSREVYSFSSDRPEGLVDPRDASTLIRSGLFRQKPA